MTSLSKPVTTDKSKHESEKMTDPQVEIKFEPVHYVIIITTLTDSIPRPLQHINQFVIEVNNQKTNPFT